MLQPLWKTVWLFLTKSNILLPYDPAILLFGIYPKELKSYICTMFITALFKMAGTWKQLRCVSVSDWINEMWYIQTMDYYSSLKRNELLNHENMWRKLKCTLPSERSQSKKASILYDYNYVMLWKRQN